MIVNQLKTEQHDADSIFPTASLGAWVIQAYAAPSAFYFWPVCDVL